MSLEAKRLMVQATDCNNIAGADNQEKQTNCRAAKGCKWESSTNTCSWCPAGEKGVSGACQACTGSNSEDVANPGRAACLSSGGSCGAHSELKTIATKKQCLCSNGFGADSVGDKCEECKAGTFHALDESSVTADTVVCVQCPSGQVSTAQASSCTQCGQNNELNTIANKLQSACVCKGGFGAAPSGGNGCVACTENTYHKENLDEGDKVQCAACPENKVANSDHTDCVDPKSPDAPSMASAATIAAIVIALLAVVAAAATAAVVAVRARKARAAEAEALTAENM